MSARRLPIGLLAPIALVVLITALGFLQYRWVGQVSERERDQLRQSLDRRARDFAADFDREIGRAYQIFTPEPGFQPASADRFARQHDEWQTASPFPGLLKTAYFAQAIDGDFSLFRFVPATRTFEAAAWPDALEPARERLKATHAPALPQMAGGANIIAFAVAPMLPAIPAILIPASGSTQVAERQGALRPSESSFNMTLTLRTGRDHAVLELDKAFLTGQMLPTLALRHFPESGAESFRVSVMNGPRDTVYSRGVPAGQTLDAASADATASFFGLRMEMFRTASVSMPASAGSTGPGVATWSTVRTQPGVEMPVQRPTIRVSPANPAMAGAARSGQPDKSQYSMVIEQSSTALRAAEVRTSSGWTLLLQHAAGSLDAAVAQARRRNLFLSFGILGVLAASAGLVMINARRSEKLAAQQMDFVATVSHELRTPLAVIRSAAQNLSAGVVHDAGQARRYGDLIESEGRRLTDMVEQVLEYAGLSDARRRPPSRATDAGTIVRDVVSASASLDAATGVDFDVRIDPDVPPMLADEDAIRRALHNLIGNALKYGQDGRWIGVTVTRGRGADDGMVLIAVADRGRGIPADDLSHIFEPFYRGRYAIDQQIRGNGLGLSLVKRIVEAHGGRASVQSTSGQGATFTLHVPVASGVAQETAADMPSPGLTNAATGRSGRSI